ncbi:hypothetical protein D3C78_1629260 [compost metagenome]
MVTKFGMTSFAGGFNLVCRCCQVGSFQWLGPRNGYKLCCSCLQLASQILKARLLLPNLWPSTGLIVFANLRKVLPWLTR